MAIFSFFKTPKPKQFNFKPRHYDAKKEKLQEIIDRHKDESKTDPDAMKSRISYGFQNKGRVDKSYESNIRRKSNRRLLLILVVLVLLSFLLLSKYSPEIINLIE
jgi:cytoskeletal protein RodZ